MTLALVTDYATLQAAIAGWLKRDDLTDSIPLFIQMYEAQMNREFVLMEPPHKSLEQTQTGTFTTNTLALPAGYSGTKRLKITNSGNVHILKYKAPSQMVYNATGNPQFYTTIGDNLEIGAGPDSSYTYEWIFDANLPSVSLGANWTITNAPDLYLYGSLLHSAPYLKNDARLATWGTIYAQLLQTVEMANTKNRQSGSPLQTRSDAAF